MTQWQTMETAPKDGTIVQLTDGRWTTAGLYDSKREKYPWVVLDASCEDGTNGWQDHPMYGPTHWMPLQETPKAPD